MITRKFSPLAAGLAVAFSLYHPGNLGRAQTTAPPSAAVADTKTSSGDSFSLLDYLKQTITFSGEIRTRWEGGLGSDFALTPASSYVLTRTRLGLAYRPLSWLRFFGEAQDARVLFYKVSPGTSLDDPFDWRQSYVEIGAVEGEGVDLRVGRQDMVLGSGRLISSGDWSNVTKTFQIARGTITESKFKMDMFAGSVVAVDTTRMDRPKPGEHFYGDYVTMGSLIPGATFEPYAFLKTDYGAAIVKGKDGKAGNADVIYLGGRLAGKAPFAIDYSVEAVKEIGKYADDDIDAFGFVGGGGWTLPGLPWKIRPNSEYIYASGDSGVTDGHHENFDYLYGPQTVNSLTGQFAWKNIEDWRAGVDLSPWKKLVATVSFRDYWLANVKDSLYNSSGTKTVTNAKATSNHVGEGVDTQFTYSLNPKTMFGIGVGTLSPGAYLVESKKTTGFIYPYLYILKRL
ncbi:MAG: alginate export family protein [Bryobacteraceae bacterium]|jgi:hypothetical protein